MDHRVEQGSTANFMAHDLVCVFLQTFISPGKYRERISFFFLSVCIYVLKFDIQYLYA
jgi:hypothetical protein